MEKDNQTAVTQTEEKTEEKVENQSTDNKEEVKTFTQEEVNSMIARERKKMPSKDDLKAFNEWKESQKTESEKQAELTQKLADTTNKNTSLEQENLVLRKGVKFDDVDYVLFKVSKMEGEFEDNLEEFLKTNTKYLQSEEVADKNVTDGVAVNKTTTTNDSGVNAILRAKHPELFN